MSVFSSIPVRENGDDVTKEWWNIFRTKLLAAFGSGVIGEKNQTITDNQSSYANITDAVIDGASYGSGVFEYTIYRDDGSSDERRETGVIRLGYKQRAGTWEITERRSGGDALNVADSIDVNTSGTEGQLRYKSDSMGGTYTGKITWKLIGTTDLES